MTGARTNRPTRGAITQAVLEVCGPLPVKRVELFGSVAQRTASETSDVDLLIDFHEGYQPGLLEMGGIREDLEERLGCPVDLLSRPAVERSTNAYRRRAILAAPITIYAR